VNCGPCWPWAICKILSKNNPKAKGTDGVPSKFKTQYLKKKKKNKKPKQTKKPKDTEIKK
jgi:hypothetical protein